MIHDVLPNGCHFGAKLPAKLQNCKTESLPGRDVVREFNSFFPLRLKT